MILKIFYPRSTHWSKLVTRSRGGQTSTRPLLPSKCLLGWRVVPWKTTRWYLLSKIQSRNTVTFMPILMVASRHPGFLLLKCLEKQGPRGLPTGI